MRQTADTGKPINLLEAMANTENDAQDEKLGRQQVFAHTVWMMRGNRPKLLGDWPMFEFKFHIKRDSSGAHSYLEETENKLLHYISKQRIIDAISTYWQTGCPWLTKKNQLLDSEAKTCFALWASTTPSLSLAINPVVQKSDDSYCFYRLPFDFDNDPAKTIEFDAPCWAELLGRMSNHEAFLAWIGSLFDTESDRQQYVWIYGEGENGKSTIGRFLTRLIGPSARSEQVPDKGDKFWSYGLLGKRLIIFPDCNDYGFPQRGIFKSLTGEDGVRVEAKGHNSFSTTLNGKFLFFSNEKPSITGTSANKRRAIFCEIAPILERFGKDYEERLWLEAPIFISECAKTYKFHTKDSKTITTKTDGIEALISDNEDRYQAFAQEYLNIHSEARPKDIELLTPYQLQDCFRRAGIRSFNEQRQYLSYMERELGIKKARGGGGDRQWFYEKCSMAMPRTS